jgi:precorrin-6A/cobalt-precorrin-6A reductase
MGRVRILLLGGTSEARRLATLLAGHDVVSSLAGRVSGPTLPEGEVRLGGFGGTDGLAAYLRNGHFDAVVDATHPFAATISQHAYDAARDAGVRHVLLRRPGFRLREEYVVVPDVHGAAEAIAPGARVFLTIGRQQVAAFVHVDAWFLVRAIDPPTVLPGRHVLLQERGPFSLPGELDLMRRHAIDTLVTKDSGGDATEAKLVAADELGVRVVVVARPPAPDGATVVESVDDVLAWVVRVTRTSPPDG